MESNGSHAKDKRPDNDARSNDDTPTTSTTTTPPDHTNKSPKKRRKVNHACVYCRRSHMTCDLVCKICSYFLRRWLARAVCCPGLHEPRLTRDQPLLNRRDRVRDASSAILATSAMTSPGTRIPRSPRARTARLDTTNQTSSPRRP
ncbi:hypothetical protein GGR52DRAFT_527140 [Hypoxylon sp. FL1284]|nr:hypothetical protein GGR52DRAFT_527140 [Hypoxylon sp. FL1284]